MSNTYLACYLSVSHAQLWSSIQQPEKSSVSVKRGHVEEELPGLKWEEEGADTADVLEPSGEVAGHDYDGVLQLPVHLGSELGVDEFSHRKDRLISRDIGVECVSVSV